MGEIIRFMKIIFLDLDGTLNESFAPAPDSALEAIKKARENGHKIFINTGRAVGEVPRFVKSIEMDGWVTSQGGFVCADGEVLFDISLDKDKAKKLYDYLDENKIIHVLETQNEIVGTKEALDFATNLFLDIQEHHGVPRTVENELCGIMRVSDNLAEEKDAKKVLYYQSQISIDEMKEIFGKDFSFTASSISKEKAVNGEIGDIRVSKSKGMEIAASHYGLTIEDTIAVGDGANDIDMLKAAGIGIAMGNADENVKAIADMITDDVRNDGLYKAFEKCGLI